MVTREILFIEALIDTQTWELYNSGKKKILLADKSDNHVLYCQTAAAYGVGS